jgi:hypothetical protein
MSTLPPLDTMMEMDTDMDMDMDMNMDINSSETSSTRRQSVFDVASVNTNATNTRTPIHQQSPPSTSTLSARRAARNPDFSAKVDQMALSLAPLVQLTTGAVHPSFPSTLLGYWLLSEAEMDSLAQFYHQRHPSRWTQHYPCPIVWRTDLSLDEKRRKIGKFIGLRGCETPVSERNEDELMEEARRMRDEDNSRWKTRWG